MAIFLLGAPSWSDGSTVTATVEKTGFPVTNLLRQSPADQYIIDDLTQIASVVIDAGSAKSFNAVSLFGSNASALASWRVRYADSEANLTSNPMHDTAPYGPCLYSDGSGVGATVSDALLPGANYTVECWVKLTVDASSVNIWYADGSNDTWLSTDASGFFVFSDGTTTCTSTTECELGTWYHVACTWRSTSNEASIFVNAVVEDTQTGFLANVMTDFTWANNPDPMIGYINEIRIWNKRRIQSEIEADFDEVLVPPVTNLRGYYHLQEGTGATTADETGTLADLTISAPTPWSFPELFWSASDYPQFAIDREIVASLFTRLPIGATARWMQIDLLDPTNVAGELRIGRLHVTPAPQFQLNLLTGSGPDTDDSSRVERAPSGRDRITPGEIRRQYQLLLMMREQSDADRIVELKEARGSRYDVLFCQDPDATTRAAQFLMQARFVRSSPATFSHFDTQEARFLLEEVV